MKLKLGSYLGSAQWVNKTGGKLRLIDKFELARQSLIASHSNRKNRIQSHKLKFYDINSIKLPDTLAVKSVSNILEELSSPEIIMHSYRTYYWAVLLAKNNRISFDEEQLLIAALAHDLGLSEKIDVLSDEHCFTVTSARLLSHQLTDYNYSEEKLSNINEAITRHINPVVSIKAGAEAHLLNAGAMLDVIGTRNYEIDNIIIDDVLLLHPRMNFKNQISHCFCQQKKTLPLSRIAFLTDNGLINLIASGPFDS